MLNQLKETIRDKYLDFGFTDDQRNAVLIVFGGFIAMGAIFFVLAQGHNSEPVDIYKVSHHGSSFQFLPLMSALHPKIALISVGAGNSYGHPAPATLELLAQAGAKVLRTDVNGAIAIAADRHRLKIRTSKGIFNFIRWE